MKSIKELYRIGVGPSSSHTMGPRKAAEKFLEKHPEAKAFEVTLYGSLAATGKGHMTDVAIIETACTGKHRLASTILLAIPPQRNDFQIER